MLQIVVGNVDHIERQTSILIFIKPGCVASGAMLGYAYSSGLLDIIRNVEVRVVDEEEEEDEDY